MQAQNIDRLFTNLTFEKTATEIVSAANTKISQINAKIEERVGRISTLREENRITDAVLVDVLNQMREAANKGREVHVYNSTVASSSGRTEEVAVGAGLINNLLTEQDFITAEKQQVERLNFIVRNLRDVTKYTPSGSPFVQKFTLSFDELRFLGF